MKECPRCHGDLKQDSDQFGSYESCIQCGYLSDPVQGQTELVRDHSVMGVSQGHNHRDWKRAKIKQEKTYHAGESALPRCPIHKHLLAEGWGCLTCLEGR